MNIKITGKELKATEAIKEYAEKKLERIEKYFGDEEIDVVVTIKSEKNVQIADINVSAKGNVYRAATENKDLYAVWELGYVKPRIVNVSITRCNSEGVASDEGQNGLIIFDWECAYKL